MGRRESWSERGEEGSEAEKAGREKERNWGKERGSGERKWSRERKERGRNNYKYTLYKYMFTLT